MMHVLEMVEHGALLDERALAAVAWAHKHLLGLVGHHVSTNVCSIGERLMAARESAHVRPLTRVRAKVPSQRALFRKAPRAILKRTLERPLSSVFLAVALQGEPSGKPYATLGALMFASGSKRRGAAAAPSPGPACAHGHAHKLILVHIFA